MTPETEHCQPSEIEAYLDGVLSECEERKLAEHLDTCQECRQRLDATAATADVWSRVPTFLKDDFFDRSPSGSSSDEQFANTQPQIKQVLDILAPTDDPHMLGRLGNYEVSGVIGAGGMGVVLKAYDRSLDRTVAIKIMAPHLAFSGAARQRFSREARAAAAVLHPNVIAIFGVATDEVLPYLVMPYIGGASLQKRLDNEGPLPIEDIVRIGLQIASGLAAAHELGLVHRDIKPANILLDQGVERLAITDFGLARTVDDASVTRTGVIAGTPQFMSPEQARGDVIDARSDLFSLGSLLYAACTGRVPFRADSPYGVLRRITDDDPRPIREINPQIPDWMCQLIRRLHAKRPEDRLQSAEEVAVLLTECLAHLNQPSVHPISKQLRVEQRLRRLPIRWLALALGLFVLPIGAVTYGINTWRRLAQQTAPTAMNVEAAAGLSQTSDSQTSAGAADEVALPWETAETITDWNDQLAPLLESIEQAIEKQLEH